ncbi:DEHA2C16104p [Debaryomyces hansenii CBS767]|uniref:DEHA2C16104p n=1 Tax=Debaryomyces hansenii (strain ATCC 36239 / CBS 767 / BCRC 21394 / JCM 1990 / NBRC 0083 / IGC 2968) TaxID=284592 RepID=Q6BTT2_DEBHA|nr:DEHA2C16104p [Debaryomyces hansenii CBS767]CAG86469.2 DEHA2C16104p [Debaryomyces hansenii CBS767]|eukprot:XP_458387.2 DEHA2C16104p [Debaryomyces hansenii CBS767]
MTEPRPQSQEKGEYATRVKSDPEEKNVANEDEEELSRQNSTTEKNPDSRDGSNADVSGYVHDMPKSPVLSSSDSLMNITPCTSNGNGMDDFVIYSDSDGASQNSFELLHNKGAKANPTIMEQEVRDDQSKSTDSDRAKRHRTRDRRNSIETTPSPKPRRRMRRKSNKSDASDRSHRSSSKNGVHLTGSGYTSTPATGKIFRNLLILEESLREQVIQQRAMRRKYLTFLSILCSIIASLTHHLYLMDSPVDGTVRVILQFTLLALLVTLMLYHLSGEYQKTIVLPRKFLSSTNKGLRQLNVRLVKIKTPLTDSITDLIREFILFNATMCRNALHNVYPSTKNNRNSKLEVFIASCQSQCQPRIGVADVKLILNARVFNTDVREGWELYRSEFWVHEGVRRRENMMSFATENYREEVLDRGKLLKKDRKERRYRRKSSVNATFNKLNEQNLNQLDASSENVLLSPYHSGMNSVDSSEVGEH